MGQENIPLWTHIGKTCIKCYTIALKLWDEFNANFVLLYFSSCSSRPWHDKWAVARSHVITHANQEKGCLGGWWIAHPRVKRHGLISPPKILKSLSRIHFNWFSIINFRLILLALLFTPLFFKTNLNCSYTLSLDIVSVIM